MPTALRMDQPGLHRVKQPVLRLQRHISDLIDEEGAAIGLHEFADFAIEGAGEGAGFVAEQFAVDQIGGQGGTVYRQHRLLGTRACGMHRLRHHFLADTAFALDQHGDACARGLCGNRQCRAELRLRSDDFVEAQHGRDLLGQRAQLACSGALHRRVKRLQQPFGGERLYQKIRGTSAHGAHRMRDGSVGRDHQDRQGRAAGA